MPHISVNFFDGPLHVSCLGWKVNAHVSGQSNDCLRLCNVKMKKILLGQKRGTFPCMYGLRGPSINRFEFFLCRTPDLAQSSCCEDILAQIN